MHGVVTGRLPHVGVDLGEQVLRFGIPGPAQVVHQVAKWLQWLGKNRTDCESSDCSHPLTVANPAGSFQPLTCKGQQDRTDWNHGWSNPRHGCCLLYTSDAAD